MKLGSSVRPKDSSVLAFRTFMMEREQIRLRKEAGHARPWSDDIILNTYKFTNVKREDDRTTRWMRTNWTGPNLSAPDGQIIFNCALFRYFGTVEFAKLVGWQRTWRPSKILEAATVAKRSGTRIFTGAYIVPTLGIRRPKHEVVCEFVLAPLWKSKDALGRLARTTKSWQRVGEELMQLPGFGGSGFMAKEVLQDVMQTPVLSSATDRNSWCPAGPGAQRGLNRLLDRPTRLTISQEQALIEMRYLFATLKEQLPSWMPKLELHDVQFQLCEFDKYERARLGEGRPKARYRPREP